MEEGICQEDFRIYTERNWLRHTKSPRFIIYMLLAVSLLLSTIFLIVAVSKGEVEGSFTFLKMDPT